MESARESTTVVSSKTAQELKIARYRLTFCHFLLCFIQLKTSVLRNIFFGIFEMIFNKFEDKFVFVCSFPGTLSLFTMN